MEIMVRSRGGVCQEERQGGLGGIFDDNWRRLRVGVFMYGRDVRVEFGGSAYPLSLFLQDAWA